MKIVEECVQGDLDDDDNDCGPSVAHDNQGVCPTSSGSRPMVRDDEDMCGTSGSQPA